MTEPITSLRDALVAINQAKELPEDAPRAAVGVASSFTPLHAQTFLHAAIQARRPGTRISMLPGLYGSLAESIQHVAEQDPDLCAVLMEWSDLDPRLGVRESATAPRAEIDDLAATAQTRLARIHQALVGLAARCPVVVVLPSLELPAIYASPAGRVGLLEARLQQIVAEFAALLHTVDGVRVAAFEDRSQRDLQSDLRSGFPYTSARAAELADLAARTLAPPAVMKGIITDLDDTLWRGLVGEIGPDAVSWDLDSGSLVHGLYQQLLAELARRGILVGVCSKNEAEVVATALKRADLLVPADAVFPVEASWGPKSEAVGRILQAWNIGADAVVFVDDSDLELAEVAAAHPGIGTRKFLPQDPRAVEVLLAELNTLFWREQVTAEDVLRLNSLRAAAALAEDRDAATDSTQFLRDLGGRVEIDADGAWSSPRSVELINKTNQFNLNGRRLEEAEWRKRGERPGAVGWSVTYTDKFGSLGAISVLSGAVQGETLTVDSWVLSCRAFSRAIEQHVIAALAEKYAVSRIAFDFQPTERNGVTASLMKALGYTEGEPLVVEVAQLDLGTSTGIHTVAFTSP